MPVGTPHSFKNESGKPARMLISVAPAGFDEMFLECGVPVVQGATTAPPPTNDEIEKLMKIAPRYGIEIRLPEALNETHLTTSLYPFSAVAIAANWSAAVCKSSAISWASASGSGKFSQAHCFCATTGAFADGPLRPRINQSSGLRPLIRLHPHSRSADPCFLPAPRGRSE